MVKVSNGSLESALSPSSQFTGCSDIETFQHSAPKPQSDNLRGAPRGGHLESCASPRKRGSGCSCFWSSKTMWRLVSRTCCSALSVFFCRGHSNSIKRTCPLRGGHGEHGWRLRNGSRSSSHGGKVVELGLHISNVASIIRGMKGTINVKFA